MRSAGWAGADGALIWALRFGLFACLAAALPAQIVLTATAGAPSQANPGFETASAGAKLGIALPSAPHVLVLWDFAGLGFDRIQNHNGGSLETGLQAWISPLQRPAQSRGPLLLAEAALGRRWGGGLHGYTALGAGLGWSWGDWVPFVEYRRRASFHPGRPLDHQIVLGLHFILFG